MNRVHLVSQSVPSFAIELCIYLLVRVWVKPGYDKREDRLTEVERFERKTVKDGARGNRWNQRDKSPVGGERRSRDWTSQGKDGNDYVTRVKTVVSKSL